MQRHKTIGRRSTWLCMDSSCGSVQYSCTSVTCTALIDSQANCFLPAMHKRLSLRLRAWKTSSHNLSQNAVWHVPSHAGRSCICRSAVFDLPSDLDWVIACICVGRLCTALKPANQGSVCKREGQTRYTSCLAASTVTFVMQACTCMSKYSMRSWPHDKVVLDTSTLAGCAGTSDGSCIINCIRANCAAPHTHSGCW